MYDLALVALSYCAGVLTGAAIMVASVSYMMEARREEEEADVCTQGTWHPIQP
jgi:hypothetical protein